MQESKELFYELRTIPTPSLKLAIAVHTMSSNEMILVERKTSVVEKAQN